MTRVKQVTAAVTNAPASATCTTPVLGAGRWRAACVAFGGKSVLRCWPTGRLCMWELVRVIFGFFGRSADGAEGHPRYAAAGQNGVVGVAAAPVNSTGSWRVRVTPPRTFWRPAYIGSLSRPSGDGAWPMANAPTTRCWPNRNEVEM